MAAFKIFNMQERKLYTNENCMFEIQSLKRCADRI